MAAITAQRKKRSRRYQKSLTEQMKELLPQNHKASVEINVPIRSMITGQWMDKGDALRDWQEFIFMRQEKIETKLQSGDLSSEYTRIMEQVDQLLAGQPEKVSDTLIELIGSITYMHYNKGFFDGMKIGMVMGNL